MTSETDLTGLLHEAAHGPRAAFDRLFPVAYASLRRLAAGALRRERPGHTLSATALAHETYLKLAAIREITWQNRAHFFAVAARAMRRVLVNHALSKKAQKRGAGAKALDLDAVAVATDNRLDDVLAVHDALERLQRFAPAAARIVECRVFLGMTIDETAAAVNRSPATVKRQWTAARSWLTRELLPESRHD